MFIPQHAFSTYTASPAAVAEQDHSKSAFLQAMSRMAGSLAIDSQWTSNYDIFNASSTFAEIFDLLICAPDSFAQGVIFGKLNVIQTIAANNQRDAEVDYTAAVTDGTQTYINCHAALEGHGDWSIAYTDMVDFCSTIHDLTPVLQELEALLANSPNEFCQGVIFGKMAMLLEIQSLV